MSPIPICPYCAARLDGYTAVQAHGRKPKPGDVTVCAYCSGVLIFADVAPIRLRRPTAHERAELSTIPNLARVQRAADLARERLGRPTRPKAH